MIKNLINVTPPNHKHWNSSTAQVVWKSKPPEAIRKLTEKSMVWGNDTGTWGLLWWLMLTLQGFLFREIKDIGLTFDSMVLNLKGWWECYQKQAVQNLFWEEKEFDFSCALKMPTVYWASIIYGKVSQLWHYWYVSQSTFCCWGLSCTL